jgi:hypothetical protein
MRLVIRGYRDGVLRFEETATVGEDTIDTVIPEMVARHAAILGDGPSMIELEFPDVPDVTQRFFRLGTDPSLMKDPVEIDLAKRRGQ